MGGLRWLEAAEQLRDLTECLRPLPGGCLKALSTVPLLDSDIHSQQHGRQGLVDPKARCCLVDRGVRTMYAALLI